MRISSVVRRSVISSVYKTGISGSFSVAHRMSERPISLPPQLEEMLLEYTINVLVENPDDLVSHAADYFARLRDGGTMPQAEPSLKADIKNILGNRGARRASVQAEPYDPAEDEDSVVEKFPKSESERERIAERIQDIFLFRALDRKDVENVIDAMSCRPAKEGEVIIQEGDDGDFFYVVDKGKFEAFVKDKQECVTTYEDSGSFGELALLHNQPRSATVKAATDGSLWAVSRTTFRKLVMKRAFEKRKKYMQLLAEVPELKPLTEYERMQVCDALSPINLKTEELLFKEGEEGDGMYFIEHGRLKVIKGSKKSEKEVAQLAPGEYVGEMALAKNQKRAATVIAMEDSKLAFLERKAFERLLGPCMDIMKRRMDSYDKSK